MRRAVLLKSVQRLLDEGETVVNAAYGWSRHRYMMPFAILAFAALTGLAVWLGYESWMTRAAIGAGGAAIAVASSTDYRIVAQTSTGLVLLRSSKIRQYARELQKRLPTGTTCEPVGGTGLTTDWVVGQLHITVPRSSEQAMRMIAGAA